MNNPGGFTPIYVGIDKGLIGPLKFQFKGDNSIYGAKLPIEGSVFTDRNTRSSSMVDLMKPFQIGYNIVNNQIADILVDELGTVILLDQNTLPRHSMGEDWGKNNLAKAYVAMKNFQMLPLDTSITNTENALNFQHFQKLDLEQSQRLLSRINLANYFKKEAYEVIGINPQRMGQQIAQQTATGVEQAINASYAQTEVYFIQHCDYLMPRVHQMRTDLAQYYHSTKPSLRLQYMTTADEKVNFQVEGTDLMLRDLNIFCSTTANHRAVLEQLKQLAINNNTTGASIYDLGKMIQSDSIAELNRVLKESEDKQRKLKGDELAQQKQMQDEMIASQEKQKQMQIQADAEKMDKQLENNVVVAEIKASGYGAMADVNQNQISDYQDSMKEIRETQQYQDQVSLERQKESNKMDNQNQKSQLEREKMLNQKEIADKQLQIARENKNRYDKPNSDKKKK
jgi:hypothetical protein